MILTLHTSAGPTLGRSNAERPNSQAQPTFFKNPNSFMTDQEIVSSLIAREASVTEQFFFKDCRPLLMSVIRRVFEGQVVEYDEIINEIYILLMKDDAKKLRQFQYQSTLHQWLKTVAIRHCLLLKQQGIAIDPEGKEPHNNSNTESQTAESSQAKMDLDALLSQMKNQRYALVLQLLMVEEREPEEVARRLSVTVDNLYNIKCRAIKALCKVARKDTWHYARKR